MKKTAALLVAAVLCILAACGVKGPDQEQAPTEPDPSQASTQPTSTPLSAGISDGESDEPVYFFVGSLLVGSWEGGSWRSLNDTGGEYGLNNNEFYIADILAQPRYGLYSRNGKIGWSDFALFSAEQGLGGFAEDMTEAFKPYSKNYPEAYSSYRCEIPLPAALGQELEALTVPDYCFFMSFSYESVLLATNSPYELSPVGRVFWGWPDWASENDLNEIRRLLDGQGISAGVNITDMACIGAFDQSYPSLLVANTPTGEGGYLDVLPQDGGIYSIILMRCEDGSYETVYERYLEYTTDVTSHFQIMNPGLFDLNNDGEYEVVATIGEWEGGYTIVLSRDSDGLWQTVLRANSGS